MATRRRFLVVADEAVMAIVTTHHRYKRQPGCWYLMVSGLCVIMGLAATDPALAAENKFEGGLH